MNERMVEGLINISFVDHQDITVSEFVRIT